MHALGIFDAVTRRRFVNCAISFLVGVRFAKIENVAIAAPANLTGRWIGERLDYATPEMFGAKGDGITDDYPAIKAMAEFVNAGKCREVRFRADAIYFIGRNITATNGVTDICFGPVNGLTVKGNGATIQSMGGFNRAAVSTGTVNVLNFNQCNQLKVSDITFNGGNATITKNKAAAESPHGYGMKLNGCVGVDVMNVNCVNCITDGFLLDGGLTASNPQVSCRNVKLTNCVSKYNGRQGISIVQGLGVIIDNCEFSQTGQSAYGHHAPGLGIDVEPDYTTATTAPNQIDVDTGEILIKNCRIQGNAGGFFAYSNSGGRVQKIALMRCKCTNENGPAVRLAAADCANMTFSDNYFDCGGAYMSCGPSPYNNQSAEWVRNHFTGFGPVMLAIGNNMSVVVKDNAFISTARAPFEETHPAIIWNTESRKLSFTGNHVFVPGAAYSPQSGFYDGRSIVQLWFVNLAENNTYETDLSASAGAHQKASFSVDYGYSTGPIRNEHFIGSSPGSGDTFQPVLNGSFNTKYPFSKDLK